MYHLRHHEYEDSREERESAFLADTLIGKSCVPHPRAAIHFFFAAIYVVSLESFLTRIRCHRIGLPPYYVTLVKLEVQVHQTARLKNQSRRMLISADSRSNDILFVSQCSSRLEHWDSSKFARVHRAVRLALTTHVFIFGRVFSRSISILFRRRDPDPAAESLASSV